MPKKTNLPQRIVAYVRRNPTADRRAISEALGVSYQAVQKHLRRLEAQGLVLPGFIVTEGWDAGKHGFWVFIETRFDHASRGVGGGQDDYQERLCEAIVAKLTDGDAYAETVSFASIQILLGGNWDIVLRVHARDADAVGRFVTRYLRSHPNVVRTSTAWALTQPPPSG